MNKTKDLQKTVDTVLAELQHARVTDQESLESANKLLVTCKQTIKYVEEHYDADLAAAQEKKKAAEAERKAVVAEIDRFRVPLTKAESMVKRQMSEYLREQERIRQETERKRREEEEAKRIDAAIETGREEVLDKPIAVEKSPEPELAKGTYTTTVWKYEIVDKQKINPDYLIPDEKSIGSLVRTQKEKAQAILGDGVRVYSDIDVRARS